MPQPLIGQCGGCGAPNVNLHYTQYKALIDAGVTEPICSGCEERIIVKRKGEIMKDDSISIAERKALAAGIRAKVTDAAPAPAQVAPSK